MRFARRVPPRFLSATGSDRSRTLLRPRAETFDHRGEARAVVRQSVLHLRWAGRKDDALQDPGILELGQTLGQRPGWYGADRGDELVEAPRAGVARVEHRERPAPAEDVRHAA